MNFINVPICDETAELSPIEKLVFGFYWMWHQTSGVCFCSNTTIARIVNCSVRSVRYAKSKLLALDFIEIEERYTDNERLADRVEVLVTLTLDKLGNPTADAAPPLRQGLPTEQNKHLKKNKTTKKSVDGCCLSDDVTATALEELSQICIEDWKRLGLKCNNTSRIPALIKKYLSSDKATNHTIPTLTDDWHYAVQIIEAMERDTQHYFLKGQGYNTLGWFFQKSKSNNEDRCGRWNLDMHIEGIWGLPAMRQDTFKPGDRVKCIDGSYSGMYGREGVVQKITDSSQVFVILDGRDMASSFIERQLEAA